jgi:tetratricopeptide (TPR) repeat protein
MELDMSGRTSATYWMDCPEIYTTNDLAVSDIGGELRFYVSRADPPRYEIDIFRKSKKLFPPGLAGELEKLTAEIEVNPKYYLPWHNRGVIKHQLGDYRGAIDDFTKAIELAADHALPFHNRGLSRVKVKEYASAIDDFTNAIEIALSSQALYDRGVARALMADYENAIGDFERAAEIDPAFRARSTEQIRVCRRLMKVGKDSLV